MSQVMDKVDYPDEKIFQTMVEQSHDAVIIHTGFLIVYAAGRSLNQFGYEDPSLLVSRNILDLIFPGFHERIIGILAESDKNHSRTDFIEAEFLSPDKRRIPVEIASMPVCFRGCKSCLMFVRDIIRRKNIEDSLDASRQQLSGLFMLSHEAITVSRLEDGLVMDVNRAFLKIMNYSREEIIGKTGNDIDMWVYPEEREYAYKEIIEKGYCHSVENHYRTKDGRNLVGLVSAGLIDVRGEKCILAVTRDITERKKIEETLHETEDKFSRIFRLSPDVITITRLSDGLYIDVNDTFIKLMGYKRDEAIGRSSIELGIWSNLNDRFRIIRKIVKGGRCGTRRLISAAGRAILSSEIWPDV